MTTKTRTIHEYARELLPQFHYVARVEDKKHIVTTDAESEASQLAFHAHDNLLPDDWRYDVIHDAVNHIAECDQHDCREECDFDFADEHVDAYSPSDLLAWLESGMRRWNYVDDEASVLPDDATLSQRIAAGQFAEAREVFSLVHEWLEGEA